MDAVSFFRPCVGSLHFVLLHIVPEQPFARHLLKRRACASVIGERVDGDAAARGEFAEHFDVFRIHQPNQILHDDVHAVFVEIAVVAEAEQIQFQRFAFHHFHVGNVADDDGGEIGLARHRAEAGEFGADEFDEIIVALVFVVERFQHFGRVVAAVFGFLIAQEGDAVEFFGVAGHFCFLADG